MRSTPFAPPIDPFLSPTDCGQQIGRPDRFIRAEMSAGRLKAIRVSHKCWRTRQSWWEEYLAELAKAKAKVVADRQASEAVA